MLLVLRGTTSIQRAVSKILYGWHSSSPRRDKESSPRSVAQRRGKKVADILPKREDAPQDSAHVAEEA